MLLYFRGGGTELCFALEQLVQTTLAEVLLAVLISQGPTVVLRTRPLPSAAPVDVLVMQ